MTRFLFFISCCFLWVLSTQAQPPKRQTPQEYIAIYQQVAIEHMKKYGIPASITIAQGLFESDMGNSRLAREGNNHFGIKCKKDWTGDTVLIDDDALQECFRSYASAFESYEDHALFLKQNPRYGFLFEYASNDYKNWAYGLKKAGYATNPKYPDKLIEIIERYKLYQLDSGIVLTDPQQPQQNKDMTIAMAGQQVEVNNTPAVIARPGDSYSRVAIEHDMMVWQVYKYNDVNQDAKPIPGDIIYLKPKKRKATVDNHSVATGDDMWSISQRYGVKLKVLYRKNRMPVGTQPVPGENLSMKTTAKVAPKYTYTPPAPRTQAVNPLLSSSTSEYHTVQAGETLFGISRKYNVTVDQLKQWNKLGSDEVKPGDRLRVKAPAASVQPQPAPQQKPAEEKPQTNNPPEQTKEIDNLPEIHVVQKGETLYSIARKYKLSVEELKQMNKLDSNSVTIGMELRLR